MTKACRPERDEFVRLCADHTHTEIARRFGVTHECVRLWAKHYGCRPKPAPRGFPKGRKLGPRGGEQRTTPGRLNYYAQGGIWYPAGAGI